MEITINQLLEGKPTIIKGKEFKATKDYVNPFLDKISKFTDNFIVEVQQPDQIIVTDDKSTTYNKVWIQAIMPSKDDIKSCSETINFVYALDSRIPVYKIFRSYKSSSGLFYSINPLWLITKEIKPEEDLKFSIENLLSTTNDLEIKLDKLDNIELGKDIDSKHKLLGKTIDGILLNVFNSIAGKVKLSTSMGINAYESVYYDSASKYYSKDGSSTALNFYNALDQLITDEKKDIFNKFEKSYLVNLICEKL